MKKRIFLLPLSLFLLSLAGCNLEPPEKISVKTSAKYNFSLGNLDTGDKLGTVGSKLGNSLQSENFSIYDYQPTNEVDDTQQFVMKMDFLNYDLDFSQYLDQLDLGKNLESMSMSYDFDVPDFSIPSIKQNIDLGDVNEAINELVCIYSRAETSATISIKMEGSNNFDKIAYSTGTLDVRVYSISSFPDVSNIDFSNLPSTTANETGTIKINGRSVAISGGTGVLDLTDFEITKDGMALNCSAEIADPLKGYLVIGRVNSGSKIKKVEGLTLEKSISPELSPLTVYTADQSTTLKSCEIGTGSITFAMLPSNDWSSYSFVLTGGLNLALDSSRASTSLADVVFKNEDIVATPTVNLHFDNSTVDFETIPELTMNILIETVKSATVALDTTQETGVNLSQPLDDSALNFLKRITWEEAGINVKYKNTLPAGNEISVNLNSLFFGFNNKVKPIVSGTSEEVSDSWTEKGHVTKIGKDKEQNEVDAIDFKLDYSLPGYNDAEKTITIKNISLGDKYSIFIEVTPVTNWKSVTISNENTSFANKTQLNLGINEMLKEMDTEDVTVSNKFGFAELPLYLFCDFGDLNGKVLTDPVIKGKINSFAANPSEEEGKEEIEYIKIEGGKDVWLLGDNSSYSELQSCIVPTLYTPSSTESTEEQKDELPIVTMDINAYVDENGKSPTKITALSDLFDEMMKGGEAMVLDYDLKFSTGDAENEITVEKTALDTIKENGSTSIKATAIIVIPLKLKVKEAIVVENILPLAGISYKQEEGQPPYDILQRSSESDYENIKQYIGFIDNAWVKLTDIQLPILMDEGNYINFSIDMDGPGTAFESNKLSLEQVKLQIEPNKLLETYPLQPVVRGEIPEGFIRISRKLKIGAGISLGLQCSGRPVQVWEKSKDPENAAAN